MKSFFVHDFGGRLWTWFISCMNSVPLIIFNGQRQQSMIRDGVDFVSTRQFTVISLLRINLLERLEALEKEFWC